MSPARAFLASALCLAAAACMRAWGPGLPWQLWLPAGLLGASALLVHHRHVGSQMLVRAALWSNLLLGVIISVAGSSREQHIAVVLAAATGGALLALGRQGLAGDARGASFVPLAFRAPLTAILVMALADAQTLILFGSLLAAEGNGPASTGVASLALAGALLLGIAGLYALKVWGLLVNLVACGAIVALAATGLLELPWELRVAFVATAALQIVLAARVLVALATRAGR
jgi:hypothetical protein